MYLPEHQNDDHKVDIEENYKLQKSQNEESIWLNLSWFFIFATMKVTWHFYWLSHLGDKDWFKGSKIWTQLNLSKQVATCCFTGTVLESSVLAVDK